MHSLLFILACYGITVIVTEGSIFDKFRDYMEKINPNFLGMLFTCPLCFGTWVGFILTAILSAFNEPNMFVHNLYLNIILGGFISAGSVWLLYNIEVYLKKKISK